MPGFDRRGPQGQGPMTGRGLGYCGSGMTTNPQLAGAGRGGRPFGGGRGRCFGGGRGGWWNGWAAPPQPMEYQEAASAPALEQFEELKRENEELRKKLDELLNKNS